jgi:hypothetical protein
VYLDGRPTLFIKFHLLIKKKIFNPNRVVASIVYFLCTTTVVQSVQASVTSCLQVKLRGKRGKGSSGSFSRFLVFGWIGFAGSNETWPGSLLLAETHLRQ